MNELFFDKKVVSLVVYLISQVNGTSPENIKLDDSLITDLTMDSVEIIDLLMRLEEIGVTIPESDISSRLNVADIVQRVQESA